MIVPYRERVVWERSVWVRNLEWVRNYVVWLYIWLNVLIDEKWPFYPSTIQRWMKLKKHTKCKLGTNPLKIQINFIKRIIVFISYMVCISKEKNGLLSTVKRIEVYMVCRHTIGFHWAINQTRGMHNASQQIIHYHD